jgi:hypothetical protein
MSRILFGILCFLLASNIGATIFSPTPFEKQVQESDGIVEVEFIGINYKKIQNDQIITEASFRIVRSVGLSQDDVIYRDNFKVVYPGGVWGDKTYYTYGTPQFLDGGKYILLIKKTKLGFELNNLSMGKYDIIIDNGTRYISSSVYPFHPRLGRIKFTAIDNFALERWGMYLSKNDSKKYQENNFRAEDSVAEETRDINQVTTIERNVASKEDKEIAREDIFQTYWPIILFAVLGLFSTIRLRRKQS